jgi:hypothetical protein
MVLDPPNDQYHLEDLNSSTLRDIVHEHTPLRTKEMPRIPLLPYHNKDIQTGQIPRRHIERLVCEMFKVRKII